MKRTLMTLVPALVLAFGSAAFAADAAAKPDSAPLSKRPSMTPTRRPRPRRSPMCPPCSVAPITITMLITLTQIPQRRPRWTSHG